MTLRKTVTTAAFLATVGMTGCGKNGQKNASQHATPTAIPAYDPAQQSAAQLYDSLKHTLDTEFALAAKEKRDPVVFFSERHDKNSNLLALLLVQHLANEHHFPVIHEYGKSDFDYVEKDIANNRINLGSAQAVVSQLFGKLSNNPIHYLPYNQNFAGSRFDTDPEYYKAYMKVVDESQLAAAAAQKPALLVMGKAHLTTIIDRMKTLEKQNIHPILLDVSGSAEDVPMASEIYHQFAAIDSSRYVHRFAPDARNVLETMSLTQIILLAATVTGNSQFYTLADAVDRDIPYNPARHR